MRLSSHRIESCEDALQNLCQKRLQGKRPDEGCLRVPDKSQRRIWGEVLIVVRTDSEGQECHTLSFRLLRDPTERNQP
jgi:hypothetical protein